jgi:glycosyltransferase involved in cell wall biosynthesis
MSLKDWLVNMLTTSCKTADEKTYSGVNVEALAQSALLSIFIPTINRAKDLAQCLKTVLPDAKSLGIPIYIADNCSDDNSSEVIESFKRDYKYLYCHRHANRLTMDENQNYYTQLASTKYCLMIADDDGLEPEALLKIIDVLLKYEPDFILLNAYHYKSDLITRTYKSILIDSDQAIRDPLQVLDEFVFKMHFSTLVINLELAKVSDFAKYEGTYHAYVGGLFEYLRVIFENRGEIKGIVTSEPLIMIRDGVKTYSAEKVAVLLERFPALFDLLPEMYRRISVLKKNELLAEYSSIKSFLVYKAEGALKYSDAKRYREKLDRLSIYKIKLVSLVPKYVIRALLLVWHKFKYGL